jgi:thiamine-monophosphate kinase
VNVTAWGYLESGNPLCRSGARPEDHILLIGKTGYSRLGLEYLENSRREGLSEISNESELRSWAGTSHPYEWLSAHYLPEVHWEPALWIGEKGLANSMIDVSDGLGHDLLHLLEESQLSGELELEKIPYPKGLESPEDAREYALNGGEDYSLLFTVSNEQLKVLNACYPTRFPPFVVIGRVHPGPVALYLKDQQGRRVRYQSRGFKHFL